jgi:hypothetical protein
MSRTIELRAWVGALLCVGAFALLAEGFQRPPPAKEPGLAQAATQCRGTGKGELLLPAQGEDGRMSGLLVDCDRVREYRFEALLTGFVPGGPAGQPGYWFGGLYGNVWELGDAWAPAEGSYGLQGGWKRTDERCGTFWADALRFTDSGRLEVVGRLYGRFDCDETGSLGLSADWGDAAPPAKTSKRRYHDAAGQPGPKEAYGDAASVPRKAWPKTRFGDARDNWTPPPYGDAASVPRKGWPKTRFDDARDGWAPPPFGDAASVPRKAWPKTRLGDARDNWTPPPYGDAASVPRKAWPKTRYEDARDGWTPPPFGDAASVPRKAWPKTRYRDAEGSQLPQVHATLRLRFSFFEL